MFGVTFETNAEQILKIRQEPSGSVVISNITGVNFAGRLKCLIYNALNVKS